MFNFKLMTFLLFMAIAAQSQTKMKDVSISDLSQTVHPKDSTVSAAVLFDQGELTFDYNSGWSYALEVTNRTKIYDQDGYDQANIEISFYKGESSSERESVSHIKARIYNLEGDKIVETKIRNKDIYEEEVSDVMNQVKFTFPKVQDGSIIEYSYKYTSPHINSLPVWGFQQDIPVDFSEVTYVFPDKFLNYKPSIRGFHDVESTDRTNPGSIRVKDTQGSGSSARATVDTNIKRVIHTATDVPKIVGESYVNNISNYLSSVKYELVAYRGFGLTSPRKFLNVSWEDVTKAIYDSKNFGRQIKKQKYYKKEVQKLISKSSSELEKMNNIFDFVKERMEWNKSNSLFTSQKIKKSYAKGRGNTADINLMLTSMLQYAKLDAKPVISSTISHGIPYSPTITGLNYVTTLVKIDGEKYMLDATDKFAKPNLLPERVLNWNGIIITESGITSEIDLMPEKVSKINTMASANLSAEGVVEGKVRKAYYEHYALNFRSSVSDKSIEKQIESIEGNYDDIKVSELSITNFDDISKPVLQTYDFKTETSYVDVIGEKLYVSPLLFLVTEENPFKEKTRDYPIDFTYPRESKVSLTINIPEGFEPDYVPEKTLIALPEEVGSFQYMAVADDQKIQLTVTTNINTHILPADFYQSLKEFFQTVVDKENEKIVLKKV